MEFLQRSETGGITSNVGSVSGTAPVWLKLIRFGDSFTTHTSSDGVTWTQVSAQTISMADSAYIGLAVTSHNAAVINTSTLTNISVTKGLPPPGSKSDHVRLVHSCGL